MANNNIQLEENNVVFRHIAIQAPKGEISGICLSYENEEGALSLFSSIHEYLNVSSQISRKLLSVVFSSRSNLSYTMTLDFAIGDKDRHIYVDNIEKNLVDKVVRSLKIYKYYLIVAGYNTSAGFTLLPIEQYHLFKNSLIVDSKEVSGNTNDDFDWMTLFGGKAIYIESVDLDNG